MSIMQQNKSVLIAYQSLHDGDSMTESAQWADSVRKKTRQARPRQQVAQEIRQVSSIKSPIYNGHRAQTDISPRLLQGHGDIFTKTKISPL